MLPRNKEVRYLQMTKYKKHSGTWYAENFKAVVVILTLAVAVAVALALALAVALTLTLTRHDPDGAQLALGEAAGGGDPSP